MEHRAENEGMSAVHLGRGLRYESSILKMYEDTVLANGHKAEWDFIHHDGAAAVLPVANDGRILMMYQHRNAPNHSTLEISAGKLGTPDEPKVECAFRELEEEIGFRAGSKKKLECLMSLIIMVVFYDEAIDIFMAHSLIPSYQHLGEDGVVNVTPCELVELEETVYIGKTTDGKAIAAVTACARKYHSVDKRDDIVQENIAYCPIYPRTLV